MSKNLEKAISFLGVTEDDFKQKKIDNNLLEEIKAQTLYTAIMTDTLIGKDGDNNYENQVIC